MSDQARQSLSDKAASALKVPSSLTMANPLTHSLLIFQPDSEKSTPEHMKDKIKGKADHLASKVQPEVCRLVFHSSIRGTNLRFRARSPVARKSVTHSRLTMEETM
jgi:hypothetical protein